MPVALAAFGRLPPLLRSIIRGDVRTAGRLIRADPSSVLLRSPGWAWLPRFRMACIEGDTTLHLAARRTLPGIVRLLLRRGADPNAANRHGHRPLHAAASCSPAEPARRHRDQATVIRLLVRAGADPNARDRRDVAPLHTAVRGRCLEAVRTLLRHGAELRGRNGATGATPLHLAVRTTGRGGSGEPAARAAQAGIIRLLLRRGAKPSDRDGRGRSVAAWADGQWTRPLLGG